MRSNRSSEGSHEMEVSGLGSSWCRRGRRRRRSGGRGPVHAGCAALHEDAAHVGRRVRSRHSILVAGIGNIFLGDDGFGPEVMRHVEHTARRCRGFASWTTESGACTWPTTCSTGGDALVLVDALPSRGSPGTLHVFEADHESLSRHRRSRCTRHGPRGRLREPERAGRHAAAHGRHRLRGRQRRGGHRSVRSRSPPPCPMRSMR